MTRPECECTGPGWCERHGVRKSAHMVKLCQSRDDYFLLWEAGRGPGQVKRGLGDLVEAGLQKIGITEERYKDVKEAIGLSRDCNCGKRKAKLNAIGKKIGIG